jgi:hypothetical protein
MGKPILCIDFDGVAHAYTSPWKGPDVISDNVVPGFFEWAENANQSFELVIYSSRSKKDSGISAMRKWFIEQFRLYCESLHAEEFADAESPTDIKLKAGGRPVIHLQFANEKPPAFLTIDDRAVCFEGSWPDPQELLKFKPWNKRTA